MSEINFDFDTVIADAREKSGLTDLGNTDFQAGLKVLLQTYDNNGFSERGRKRLRRRVVDLLATRMRIEAAWKQYPEILEEQIKQPLYLTGLPRTGTSALLNLLANDPASRPLKLWEGMTPDPCEDFEPGKEDPRYLMMKAWQEEQNRKNPDFSKIHHTTADTPEECIHLLNHTFSDVQFGMETMMEPYGSWFQEQDLGPSYRYYADMLRMLQWQRPGDRWLLKSPAHLWALDKIVDMFPDACIIITHRNPLEAVTSYASMMNALMVERDFDRKTLGPTVMEYLARKVEASMAQRQALPSGRVLDIQYKDFTSDSLAVVRRIYDTFELPLSETTDAAFQRYADTNKLGKHGKHEYDFAEFGLDRDTVIKRFEPYIQKYDIVIED